MPPHCIVLYRSQEERFAIKEMAFGDGGGDDLGPFSGGKMYSFLFNDFLRLAFPNLNPF
jgi:hypothetical protein